MRFRLDVRKKFFTQEGGEALAQDAQRHCGCPISGGVQSQAGQGPAPFDLEGGSPAHSMLELEDFKRSLPT